MANFLTEVKKYFIMEMKNKLKPHQFNFLCPNALLNYPNIIKLLNV